jgi:hypothetical protein
LHKKGDFPGIFPSVQIAFINENAGGYLGKAGTSEINSGHLYKNADCPGIFPSVQIAFINENTEGYLGKAGLLKSTRDICIKKGTVLGFFHLSRSHLLMRIQKDT